jgi:3-oxoacyl-[acyl-carrier protein] reductase
VLGVTNTFTSQGIGRAIVETFLEEGAHVAYCARKVTGREFESAATKSKVFGSQVDISDTTSLEAWINDTAKLLGGIDIVINNGGFVVVSSVYTRAQPRIFSISLCSRNP